MDFLSTMKAKAKADKKVIVLPESYEKRNLEAAAECLKEELADIILIGKKDKIMEAAGSFDVSKAIFVPRNLRQNGRNGCRPCGSKKEQRHDTGRSKKNPDG